MRAGCFGLLLLLLLPPVASAAVEVTVESSRQPLRGWAIEGASLRLIDENARPVAERELWLLPEGEWTDAAGARVDTLRLHSDAEGRASLPTLHVRTGTGRFSLGLEDGRRAEGRLRVVAAVWVLLPPLLAIVLALWLRQVLLALAAGILGGAWILTGSPVEGFLSAFSGTIAGAMSDGFQAAILMFTAALGGMVGVMARAGGTHGLVEAARHWIRGPRSAQFVTALLGLVIFFDDYANTLLVGNTMRPVTDRFRVSREKLSYLVDSTAAPVATVAVLSTWVGYQLGLIGDGLEQIGRSATEAYTLFVQSIPYSAYSWFAMALVFWLILQRRDFGPMHRAERRCRGTGEVIRPGGRPLMDDVGQDLSPREGMPLRAHVALLPIGLVLVATALGLYVDGRRSLIAEGGVAALADSGLREIYATADPASALVWAVMLGSILVLSLAVGERLLRVSAAMDAWVAGAKAMMPALIILILAWSIGDICEALGTGPVVVEWATGSISARLLPTVAFLVAAFLGFSTGTSWGTMAILMPIVIPLADALPTVEGLGGAAANGILLSSVASVLSGSVFGDHCSPISDTTIMSSMASGADHVDHVRTQLPYALSAGAAAVLLGTLPAGYGIPAWLTLPVGVLALGLLVRLRGRSAEVA